MIRRAVSVGRIRAHERVLRAIPLALQSVAEHRGLTDEVAGKGHARARRRACLRERSVWLRSRRLFYLFRRGHSPEPAGVAHLELVIVGAGTEKKGGRVCVRRGRVCSLEFGVLLLPARHWKVKHVCRVADESAHKRIFHVGHQPRLAVKSAREEAALAGPGHYMLHDIV